MQDMWFDDWESIVRILVVGSIGYVALVTLLRVSGKRTLSKMNSFDFVITIALGSTFASLFVSDTVTLAEGVTALALLIFLQWIVTSLYVRSAMVAGIVRGEPQVLYWKGEYLDAVLRRERITREEVLAAMRDSNVAAHDAAAAVLETDGRVTVIELGEEEANYPLEDEATEGLELE